MGIYNVRNVGRQSINTFCLNRLYAIFGLVILVEIMFAQCIQIHFKDCFLYSDFPIWKSIKASLLSNSRSLSFNPMIAFDIMLNYSFKKLELKSVGGCEWAVGWTQGHRDKQKCDALPLAIVI